MEDIDEYSFKEQLTDCCYKCGVREDEAYAMYGDVFAIPLLSDSIANLGQQKRSCLF